MKVAETRPRSKHSKLKIVYGLFLVVMAVLLVVGLPNFSSKQIVWLDRAEFNLLLRGGKFGPLKQRLERLMAPLLALYHRDQTDISIKAGLYTIRADKLDTLGLGTAMGTNLNGTRAWLFTSEEMKALKNHLENTDNVDEVNTPGVTTGDGTQAQLRSVEFLTIDGKTVPVGFVWDMIPTRSGASVKLVFGVTDYELPVPTPTRSSDVKSSFDVACRMLVPNGGTLVLAGGQSQKYTNKIFVFTATAQLIDARGMPILTKPRGIGE